MNKLLAALQHLQLMSKQEAQHKAVLQAQTKQAKQLALQQSIQQRIKRIAKHIEEK